MFRSITTLLLPISPTCQTAAMLANAQTPHHLNKLQAHLLDALGAKPGTLEYLSSLSVLNMT